MSNLPPGVTESMIPGNRPEDLAEEAFWEALTATGLVTQDVHTGNIQMTEDEFVTVIDWVRDYVWRREFEDGRQEAQIDQVYRHLDGLSDEQKMAMLDEALNTGDGSYRP